MRPVTNKMVCYRIYTEDKNTLDIKTVVSEMFSSYSLTPCVGIWKGTEEYSLIVEILSDEPQGLLYAEIVANGIKVTNAQDSVLLSWHNVEAKLL